MRGISQQLLNHLAQVALIVCFSLVSSSLLAASLDAFKLEQLQGAFTQGGMLQGKVPAGTQVFLNGKAIKTSAEGYFVFGFGRDAKLDHTLSLKNAVTSRELPFRLSKRDYKIQRIEGIPKKIMQPDAASIKRIRDDAKLVRQARATSSDRLDYRNKVLLPVEGAITGVYGSQRYFNDEPKRPHFGLDMAAPKGTPVIASLPGVVTLAHDDMFYSGGTLLLDHGFGISSTFIHLSKILVKEGEEVKAGDVIGEVGASGRATGPHLDWRMNWYGVRLDPQLLLEEEK